MPYRPIYVASYTTLGGESYFTWDRTREEVWEEHVDDLAAVQLGHLRSAHFQLIDVPTDVPTIQLREYLAARPDLWRPPCPTP